MIFLLARNTYLFLIDDSLFEDGIIANTFSKFDIHANILSKIWCIELRLVPPSFLTLSNSKFVGPINTCPKSNFFTIDIIFYLWT